MGIHIWKRFGPRSAFQYLHLDGVYTVGTKAKKKRDVFLKGGSGYIYKQAPDEKKKWENQQLINTGHSDVWKKFYGGAKNTRSIRWSAKPTLLYFCKNILWMIGQEGITVTPLQEKLQLWQISKYWTDRELMFKQC